MDPKMLIVETEEDDERGPYYLPWADLRQWLRKKCASANRHLWIKRLDPHFSLIYERWNDTELILIYRCKTGEYVMRLSYYHHIRGLNYGLEDEPFIFSLHVTNPYGKKPFGIRRDLSSLTVAQAGRLILSVLLNSSNATTAHIC
jgi:hypothetical protein